MNQDYLEANSPHNDGWVQEHYKKKVEEEEKRKRLLEKKKEDGTSKSKG